MLLSIVLTTRRLTTVRSHRTHLNIKSCILNIKYITILCATCANVLLIALSFAEKPQQGLCKHVKYAHM